MVLDLTAVLGLSTVGLGANQRNVAGALDNFFNNGGALPPNFVALFGLSGPNLGGALSALSGDRNRRAAGGLSADERFPGADGRSVGVRARHVGALERRRDQLRAGA